jgi:hypothetical protein
MLVDTYEETAHVTNSDMLETLANKSVIFRFHNIRGITLLFLLNFLLMWLAYYRRNVTATAKVQTLFMDEQHFLKEAKNRNDIGDTAVQAIASTGAKRGLRLVLANQLISELDSKILGNLACKIITRLTSPADIGIIQKSMGLSPDQALSITRLEKRQIIASYIDYQMPFKVRVDEFSFPPGLDEMAMEKISQDFLSQVTWDEDSGLSSDPSDPEAVAGDALKVFMRIAEKTETIDERCKAISIERGLETKVRKLLEAKGYVAEGEITLGNKIKIYGLTAKGYEVAKKMKIRAKRYKSGMVHEFLLERIGRKLLSLNSQYRLQRNSQIAREYGIQPDSVLNMTSDYRVIIEIVCTNVKREVEILNKERTIPGVDMVLAIAANKKVKKALEEALEDSSPQTHSDNEPARLVVLDAGECLCSPSKTKKKEEEDKFDWPSVFERP